MSFFRETQAAIQTSTVLHGTWCFLHLFTQWNLHVSKWYQSSV